MPAATPDSTPDFTPDSDSSPDRREARLDSYADLATPEERFAYLRETKDLAFLQDVLERYDDEQLAVVREQLQGREFPAREALVADQAQEQANELMRRADDEVQNEISAHIHEKIENSKKDGLEWTAEQEAAEHQEALRKVLALPEEKRIKARHLTAAERALEREAAAKFDRFETAWLAEKAEAERARYEKTFRGKVDLFTSQSVKSYAKGAWSRLRKAYFAGGGSKHSTWSKTKGEMVALGQLGVEAAGLLVYVVGKAASEFRRRRQRK